MSLRIAPVSSRRERRLFRDLPARLHGDHPAFIPMLDAAFRDLFDRKRNPFWARARSREWICHRGDEPVGRVGACLDEALATRVPGCGAVGFFDVADDAEAAALLFSTADGWLAEQGCTRARGALNYTIHDTAGVLVEGFDTPPTVDTTWNPPHYGPLWDAAGWKGVQDMLGCAGDIQLLDDRRLGRFAERVREKGFRTRPIDLSRFDDEAERLRRLYNAAWDDNWGHVPISRDEFRFKAKDLKAVFDPDLVRVAEYEGEPVAVLVALPDLNVAVRRSRGRLLPLGWWRLLRAKRVGGRVRTVLLGIVPGFRNRGVEALMTHDSFHAFGERYGWCEASWILADNAAMVNGLRSYNLRPYKRWRMYEKALPARA